MHGRSSYAGAVSGQISDALEHFRACVKLTYRSFRAVELIRREILARHPEATNVNAVLIDFFLYDLAKERETAGECISRVGSRAALRHDYSTRVGVLVSCPGWPIQRACREPSDLLYRRARAGAV